MTESRTVAIRQRDGVQEFEQHMRAVQRGADVLDAPRTISHAGSLGRSVSFAQLIATWANYSSTRHARTTLSVDALDDHQSYVARLHGLATAYYANRITAKDGTTNLRPALLNAAMPRILAMNKRQFDKAAKGRLTELIFVHDAHHQFHPSVYKRRPTLAELMDPELNRPGFPGGSYVWVMQPYRGSCWRHSDLLRPLRAGCCRWGRAGVDY